jgi:hypothetical protein
VNLDGYFQSAVAGPLAVVANDFRTPVSSGATCVLMGFRLPNFSASGHSNDYFLSVVGNEVDGGRYGALGHQATTTNWLPFKLNFCGNRVRLLPPFDLIGDYPGAAVYLNGGHHVNVSGNTLLAGGHGVRLGVSNTAFMLIKNDFQVATHRGIAHDAPAGAIQTGVIAKNLLGPTNGFHLKTIHPGGWNYFMIRNQYRAGAGTNDYSPFLDPASASVHLNR